MAYIDLAFLQNHVGPSVLSGALYYGGTLTANTGTVANQFISAACSYVDSFIASAYEDSVPLTSPNSYIKLIVADFATIDIFNRCGKPVPPDVSARVDQNSSWLNGIRKGQIKLAELSTDPVSGPGAVYAGPSGSVQNILSFDRLRGTFF